MNNLFEFTSEIKEKIKNWSKSVLSEIKSSFSLGTQNSTLRNEVGKYIALDTASGLRENDKEIVKAFSAALDKIKFARSLDLISEEDYYLKLEQLRDKYFSKGTQNWVKYTAQIYEYQKKALQKEKESIVSLYDDISSYASDKLTEVLNKQAAFADKIKNSSGLFNKNTVTMNGVSDTYYSMHSMQEDIKRIKRYQSLLEEFSQRVDALGISEEIKNKFLKELQEEDFNIAISALNSIKGSTDEAVFNYLSDWNERNILADSIAAKSFESEFNESIEDSYEKMKELLTFAGYEIPEGFFTSGSVSAQRFGDAFVEEIELQMERIRSIIDAFNIELSGYSQMYGGNTYNTSNNSYNIQSDNAYDTVEQIRRYETVKRLAGIA